MSLIDKIPAMDDAALVNLLANARRLAETGAASQQAQAAEILPALEEQVAIRKARKLEAAAARRSAARGRAAAAKPASAQRA